MPGNPVSIQRQRHARLLSKSTVQGAGTNRTGGRQAQALQAYRASMREDGAELRLIRRACSRLHLDQIRPHGLKASAPATLLLSRLNIPPHMIAVYASPWLLPPTAQHLLPGRRYPLPGPDSHRLDLVSFLVHQWVSLNKIGLDRPSQRDGQGPYFAAWPSPNPRFFRPSPT